jgi:hypothetical protein
METAFNNGRYLYVLSEQSMAAGKGWSSNFWDSLWPEIYSPLRCMTYSVSYLDNLDVEGCEIHNLPVVLYGYGTWSLTLREVHRLKVFENRVLRRILE